MDGSSCGEGVPVVAVDAVVGIGGGDAVVRDGEGRVGGVAPVQVNAAEGGPSQVCGLYQ